MSFFDLSLLWNRPVRTPTGCNTLISCVSRQDQEAVGCLASWQGQGNIDDQVKRPPPAKARSSRRHALRPSPGPSPSLLGPDASSPARTASAAGVAWQRVSLLYEVQGRSPLPSMSNADSDPGHTLERVTAVTPLSETTSDTLPKHQQRGRTQSALQVLTVPFASTPPRRGGAYSLDEGLHEARVDQPYLAARLRYTPPTT